MADYATNIVQISEAQADKEVTANANFNAASPAMAFGMYRILGLTWYYYGGIFLVSGARTSVANGTLALTDNATCYLKITAAGVVNFTTSAPSGWPDMTNGDVALYQVTTLSGAVTNWLDKRTAGGGGSGAAAAKVLLVAVSDETTAITTGAAKVTFRMPYAMTLSAVRASLNVTSSSGTPTVDINESGTSILSTKLTIDAGELTSTTAATPAVISDTALADDAEITVDIDTAGTGAKGLKITLVGT